MSGGEMERKTASVDAHAVRRLAKDMLLARGTGEARMGSKGVRRHIRREMPKIRREHPERISYALGVRARNGNRLFQIGEEETYQG